MQHALLRLFLVISTLFPVSTFSNTLTADSLVLSIDSTINASCAGAGDGAIFISLQGGTPPFSFLWSNGSTTQHAQGLSAGFYQVVVTDSAGMQTSLDSIQVSQPEALVISLVQLLQPDCEGALGSLSVAASGGTPPYSYDWNTGQTGASLDSLSAGDYEVTVTDAQGCTAIFATVLHPQLPTATISGTGNVTCLQSEIRLDGTASFAANGFAYQWTAGAGGNFSSSTDSLIVFADAVGVYALEITDTLNGCTAVSFYEIAADTLRPVANAGSGGLLSCFVPELQLDGSLSSQGVQYTYLWDTADGNILSGETSLTPLINASGNYLLIVTDTLNGCTATSEVLVDSNFNTPVVEAQGGTITCFDPILQLAGIFDTTNAIFTWLGPNGFFSNLQNPEVSSPGDYALTVTDTLSGCSASTGATVVKLGADLVLTTAGGALTCTASSVQLTAEANATGVVYSWMSPNGFESTEQNPVVAEAGDYVVNALDTVYGCTALDTAYVIADTLAPTADAGSGANLDCNITSASLDGAASSQGADFQYLWTTSGGNIVSGETTLFPLVNAPGIYLLTVTSQVNGCSASEGIVVTASTPVVAEVTATAVTCHSTGTGTAIASAAGGTGNYTYAWSSGSLEATATGLVAGEYFVTITDGSGCSTVASANIGQPDPLGLQLNATGQSLANINDGQVSCEPTGGTLPYSFAWSNGATEAHLTNLAPGSYTVTVADANGCVAIATGNVNEFLCTLMASVSGTDVPCFGEANGTATIALQNEVQPLVFAWSNGDSLQSVGGLAAGLYSVTVSDSTNCSNELSILIGQPAELLVSELFHADVACAEDANGLIVAAVNGGVQPYVLSWSNGATGPFAANLGIGDYSLLVTDKHGCTRELASTIVALDHTPPVLSLQPVVAVLDENGSAQVTGVQFDAGSSDDCSIAQISVSKEHFDCTELGEHFVTITATDFNGNASQGTAIVTVVDTQVPVLLCPADQAVSLCNPAVSFGLPDIIDNCPIDALKIELLEGLPSGADFPVGPTIQRFRYTDAAGNAGECSFTVTVNGQLEIAVGAVNSSCHGLCDGSIALALAGGVQPYQISWSNGATGEIAAGLCPGDYTATITDGSGCEATLSASIAEPAPLELAILEVLQPPCPADASGFIAADANGGTQPYSFGWSNGETGNSIADLSAGTYMLEASDANGCTQSVTVEISAQDVESPVLSLQTATLSLGADGTVSLAPELLDAGSTDNCGIASWTVTPASFDCSQTGDNTVVLTATDGSGNTAAATVTVTIVDDLAPVLTCPSDIAVGFCDSIVTYAVPQVQDNCGTDPALLQLVTGFPSSAVFPVGVTTVAFSYQDAAGNAAACSFTVNVALAGDLLINADEPNCAAACDGSISLQINGGAAPYAIAWSNGQAGFTASDLCAGDYAVTATDAFGCSSFGAISLVAPEPLSIAVEGVTNDIESAGIGAIGISVSGGTPPYAYAWTKNGQVFAMSEDLDGIGAGQYAVAVTDANGCVLTSAEIEVTNIVGTREADFSHLVSLLPNPATDWTVLQLNGLEQENLQVYIFDAWGRRLQSQPFGGGASRVLDLSALAPGFYTVKVHAAGGVATRRLVVSR